MINEETIKGGLITKQEAKDICDKIFRMSSADETEVMITDTFSNLTRYANNHIHQNMSEQDSNIAIRTTIGKKTARISVNQLDDYTLKKAIDNVINITKKQNEIEDLLPMITAQNYEEVNTYCDTTNSFTPYERAKAVKTVIDKCKEKNVVGSGIFNTETTVLSIATSTGVFCYNRGTKAELSVFTINGNKMGSAEQLSRDVKNINVEKVAGASIEKSSFPGEQKKIEPGTYTVIFEPSATATLLTHLTMGFGALSFAEGRSWLVNRMNKKIMSSLITIEDNAYTPVYQSLPFDFEGMPRKKVVLVEAGIAKNVVYDRITAEKEGKTSTGHALPFPNPQGPMPLNLVLNSKEASVKDMISSTKKGVLVTSLHYTNVVNPRDMVITGMTRGGTFLIENGEVTAPLKTLRFNQSIIDAFNNVEDVGREPSVSSGWWGYLSSVVPAVKTSVFNFTSGTEF